MTETEQIPEPEESGSDGAQSESAQELVPAGIKNTPFPIVNTLQGLAASKNRAFGNETTSALVVGIYNQLSHDLENSRKEIAVLKTKNEKLAQLLSNCEIVRAVLKERLDSFRSNRHLRNIGLLVGTGLIGTSFQLAKNSFNAFSILCGIIGCILIFVGWFHAPKGDRV